MAHGTRRSLAGVVCVVVALNVVAWGLYAAGSAGGLRLSGVGVLAFVLGVRHAFDADHIAVIDDCSRLAARQGRRRPGLGLSFALGHSTVVLILTMLVAWTARSVAGDDFEHWRVLGGGLSTAFAAAFLLATGGLNLLVLQQIRRAGPGAPTDAGASGGLLVRLLGDRLRGSTLGAWQLFPVGFLFGLGLETASEVALIGVTGSAAAEGSHPWEAIVALPLLFAAGMALCDTANSIMMARLYDQTDGSTRRRRRFNIAMTGLTASLGLAVGGIYLAKVSVDVMGIGVLAPLAGLTEHFELLGYLIVLAYASIWVVTLAAGRRSPVAHRVLPAAGEHATAA